MNERSQSSEKGFSLIEILMVLILIAVLAAIAINAFINFKREAQEAAIKADLHVLRNSIAAQYSQMQLRCASTVGTFPGVAQINNNNITTGAGAPCTAVQVPIESEQAFVQGGIPIPPTGTTAQIIDCQTGGDCVRGDAVPCDTVSWKKQWCYNFKTGEIWLDDNTTDATGASYESY